MSCQSVQQSVLEFGWDAAARGRAAEILDHIRSCPVCQERLKLYDRITDALFTPEAVGAEPPGGWVAFQRRLSDATPVASRRITLRLRPVGAIAASIGIVVAAFMLGQTASRPDLKPIALMPSSRTSPDERPTFAPRQISEDVEAFNQVSQVFDGRASWMLVANGASDVGVENQPVLAGAGDVLLLRLTTTRAGKVASDADLLVVPGQTANLTVPLNSGGHSLHYRIGTSSGEPTRLAVWLDINTKQGGQPLAALATNLDVEPGQTVTAGQLATSAGEYEFTIEFVRARLPETKR